MRRWRTALSCSGLLAALLVVGATRPAAAGDKLPAVSDPGTSSRVETIGSLGYENCWHGVGLTNCTGPPPPPPLISPVSGHDLIAETADTQPLSLGDSFDPI